MTNFSLKVLPKIGNNQERNYANFHILFLRWMNDPRKYFIYLYTPSFPKGFRTACLKTKFMPFWSLGQDMLLMFVKSSGNPYIRKAPFHSSIKKSKELIFNLKMLLKSCISKLVLEKDLYLNLYKILRSLTYKLSLNEKRKGSFQRDLDGRERQGNCQRMYSLSRVLCGPGSARLPKFWLLSLPLKLGMSS